MTAAVKVLLIGGRHRSIRSALLSGSSTLPPKGRILMSETNYLQITHIQLATRQTCQPAISKCGDVDDLREVVPISS